MKKILLIIAAMATIFQVNAQEKWTLQQCIDHALENNIVIRQQQLTAEYQQNELQQSKNNRLPSASASLSETVSFGRSETVSGTFDNYTQGTTSGSVSGSVLIWQGGILNKTIKQNEFSLQASLQDLQKAKDDITLNVTSAYMEILFAKELLTAAETQVDQTSKQLERSKQLVEAGKVAEGTLYEIKSQLAREQLNVVNQKNTLRIAYLNLTQLIELDDYSNFKIDVPEIPELKAQMSVMAAGEVYGNAVDNRPEIKSAEFTLKSSEKQLEISKANRMPSLAAFAGISDYYYLYEGAPAFSKQVSNQLGEYVGLQLDIPLFSKFQNKTNIANSKLQIQSNKLDLESVKKSLRKEIEQAYTSAVAAIESYNANKIAVKSMEESFRYIEEKYNVGRVNSVEYNDAKTNLAVAQTDLIQAKYKFIFRSKILDFYNGIPIEL